nr:uncharacterized protein LOC117281009 [Nicotiana tomentosiformis]
MVAFAQATKTRKFKNRMERESNNKTQSAGNFGGTSSGGGESSVSTQLSRSSQHQGSRFRPCQSNMGPYQQGWSSGRFQQQRGPPYPRCKKMHFGACYMDQPIFHLCGMGGHNQRDCHSSHQSMGRGAAQPVSSAATTSTTPPPARGTPTPIGHDAARGGT